MIYCLDFLKYIILSLSYFSEEQWKINWIQTHFARIRPLQNRQISLILFLLVYGFLFLSLFFWKFLCASENLPSN